MAKNRIALVVEGDDRNGGHVTLSLFLSSVSKFYQALTRLDESLGQGQRNSHFAVVALSHSSPATVEVEPRANHGRQDVSHMVGRRLAQTIENVESGFVREFADYEVLASLRGLAAPVGDALKSVTIRVDDAHFDLTPHFASKIDVALAEHESCFGSIEGMLERINVHNDANVFTIYPDVGPKNLTCHFPRERLEAAVAAVKKRVCVTGLMKYRKLTPYPYHITVSDIEIYDPEDTLPSFDDLRGRAPDATGNLSSEDFIAEYRDGWV